MGQNCCDVCPRSMFEECMEGQKDNYKQHWIQVEELGTYDLYPCLYSHAGQWDDAVRIWKDTMMRHYHSRQEMSA